jgi:Na+/alanine symporter
MKKYIHQIVIMIFVITIVAVVCDQIYVWTGLNDLFGVELNFLNWYGIVILANLLFPAKDMFNKQNKKNDTEGPKVPRDISSHGF